MGRNLEIERKFLVRKRPQGLNGHRSARIVQGYFPMGSKAVEVRLRRKGSEHFITVKGGRGAQRTEVETKISAGEFRALWPLTTGGRIAKRRYEIPWKGLVVELDVYEGPHRGLMTADVEFDSAKACRAFEAPKWMGREISGSKIYANRVLARRGGLPAKRRKS